MKYLISLILSFNLYGAQTPSSIWKLYSWGNNALYKPYNTITIGNEDAEFNFPIASKSAAYPAFLTTVLDSSVLGNLTDKSISATINLTISGNPLFRFGGQNAWNNCNIPANTRIFISSSSATYNLSYAGQHEDEFWWSHGGVATINAQTGYVILNDSLANPSNWSNANGHSAVDHIQGFNIAVSNVRQIGISFGGGCYFDVGIAIFPNTGNAILHLINYEIQ